MPRQPGLQGSPEQAGHDGSPVTPRDLAFRAMIQHAPQLRAHACKLLLFLLELSVRRGSPVIRAGRRNVMRYCGFSRKGYDRARKDIAVIIPVIPGLPGSPLTFDLRRIWGEQTAGLQGSPEQQPGLQGSPGRIPETGPPGEPAFLKPGLHGEPGTETGPPGEPAFSKPGLHGSPVPISTTGPPGEPAFSKPGLHGSPVEAKKRQTSVTDHDHDQDLIRSDLIRSAIPHSKPDIERARSELRRLRYVDGSPVNPSEHACAVAIDTAGGAAELAALMPRVLEHLENYPDGRPKKPRAFVRWIGPVLLSHLKQNSAAEPGKKSHGRRGESATLEKLKKSWERSQNAKPVPVS